MIEIFNQFLIQTPVWVSALLAYLIFRGIKARYPAQTSLLKLAIIPTIFAVWGIADLMWLYGLRTDAVSLWLTGIAMGTLIGWRLLAHADIRADRATGIIWRPADLTLLPLLLLTFAVKYSFAATAAISPDLLQHAGFRLADLLLSGAFTGHFIGKFARYTHAYRTTGAAIGT
jgi:hypothetical protein